MDMRCVRHEVYQIVLHGHLDGEWSEWFAGLTIARTDNGETILTGPIVDQAALHGVLIKIRDLGLPLLALRRLNPDNAERGTAGMVRRQDNHSEE